MTGKQIDWDLVEAEFRAGVKTLDQIGKDHGITKGRISQVAKAKGWVRDLSAKIARQVGDGVPVVADEMDCAGYVYGVFIDAGGERFYKVGLAKQPDVRAAAHQTSLPFEARIGIAYFVPNMRQEERVLHAMFAAKLVRGEWFLLDDADLDAMAMRARLA